MTSIIFFCKVVSVLIYHHWCNPFTNVIYSLWRSGFFLSPSPPFFLPVENRAEQNVIWGDVHTLFYPANLFRGFLLFRLFQRHQLHLDKLIHSQLLYKKLFSKTRVLWEEGRRGICSGGLFTMAVFPFLKSVWLLSSILPWYNVRSISLQKSSHCHHAP